MKIIVKSLQKNYRKINAKKFIEKSEVETNIYVPKIDWLSKLY